MGRRGRNMSRNQEDGFSDKGNAEGTGFICRKCVEFSDMEQICSRLKEENLLLKKELEDLRKELVSFQLNQAASDKSVVPNLSPTAEDSSTQVLNDALVSGFVENSGKRVATNRDRRRDDSCRTGVANFFGTGGRNLGKYALDKVGVIAGDSMVRELGNSICRSNKSVTRCCLPGAMIKDVKGYLDGCNLGGSAVVWVGTNDVNKKGTESIMSDFKDLLDNRGKRLSAVLGLLPRPQKGKVFEQKILSVNTRLRGLCEDRGVIFVDLWDNFEPNWLRRDGIHLNRWGVKQVFRAVMDAIDTKNGVALVGGRMWRVGRHFEVYEH